MKVTILETGRAPGRLSEVYPRYPDMIASLLAKADEKLAFEAIALVDGTPPPAASACDAVIITGSPAGVYDSTPWMDPLRAFIREAFATRTPLAGICFGHQIIADALGGDVRKSDKGWGVGRHTYSITEKRSWMVDAEDAFSLAVSHQDQVITPPTGAATLARSDHTDHAMLAYEGAPIISVQGHPEFSDNFVAALYGARRGLSLSDDMADAAIGSLAIPEDNALVGEWIARFFRSVRG